MSKEVKGLHNRILESELLNKVQNLTSKVFSKLEKKKFRGR